MSSKILRHYETSSSYWFYNFSIFSFLVFISNIFNLVDLWEFLKDNYDWLALIFSSLTTAIFIECLFFWIFYHSFFFSISSTSIFICYLNFRFLSIISIFSGVIGDLPIDDLFELLFDELFLAVKYIDLPSNLLFLISIYSVPDDIFDFVWGVYFFIN